MVSLDGIVKRYPGVVANDGAGLVARPGEVHALVGENGSGKSTLLGVASGFLAPDEGTVEIGGQRLQHADAVEALRYGLGMAYQNYAQSAWSLLPVSAVTEMTAVTLFAINLFITFSRPAPAAKLTTREC